MRREMIKNVTNKIYVLLMLCIYSGFLLTACNPFSSDSESNIVRHDGKNLSVNLAVPMALTGIPVSDLNAKVSVDGDLPIGLNVNADNTVTGQIPNVIAGDHQLVITYFVFESGLEVNVAIAIKDVEVISNETTLVVISDSDLNRNIDDDGDGYTNLSEIRIGTLALDKFDSPGGESPLFVVSNGSFGKSTSGSYEIKHALGASVSGVSRSTNYIIVSGFGSY